MKPITLLLLIAVMACSPSKPKEEADSQQSMQAEEPSKPEVYSLSGEPLPEKQMSASTREKLEKNLSSAEEAYNQFPDSVDFAIWKGRRIAYLGRYHDAIEFYTQAIEKFPNDHRLYRHRGHRYISTRQLDKAIADFEKATELALKVPNQTEPDGIPNKLNQPTGNDRFNIFYHHGLAHYVKGDFEKALPIYQKCMEVSDNNDLVIATSYWLYMTLHRLGQVEETSEVLAGINADMEVIENDGYLDLLLLFKGEKTPEEIMETAKGSNGVGSPTLMYGLGNYYLQNGDKEKALEIWQEVLTGPNWDAFGFIAAEGEVVRK